jgi:hypothetical protein
VDLARPQLKAGAGQGLDAAKGFVYVGQLEDRFGCGGLANDRARLGPPLLDSDKADRLPAEVLDKLKTMPQKRGMIKIKLCNRLHCIIKTA